MQKNIKRLLKDCFAHLGKVALYESNDKSHMVQVLKQQPNKLYEIGDGKFVGEMLFLEVSIFDILRPMVGCAVETQRMIRNERTKCLSCTIDEGRSLKVGLQEQALNNHKLL